MHCIEVNRNLPVVGVTNAVESWRKTEFLEMSLGIAAERHDQLAITVVELSAARLLHFGHQDLHSVHLRSHEINRFRALFIKY